VNIANIIEVVKLMNEMSMAKVRWLFFTIVLSSFFLGVDIDLVELIKVL